MKDHIFELWRKILYLSPQFIIIIPVDGKEHKQINDLAYIHLYSSPSTGTIITNSQSDQLPVGMIAKLVEHFTGIT